MSAFQTDCEGFHRRDFLQVGSAGLLGLSLPGFLAAKASAAGKETRAKAQSVILVWLAGGPATIDMWDNKPDAPEGIRGEFKPVDTAAKGVQICRDTCPRWASVDGTRPPSCGQPGPHHPVARPGHGVHDDRQQARPRPSQYPALGSLATKLLPDRSAACRRTSRFGEIRGGVGRAAAGYLGSAFNPFIVEGHGRPRQGRGPGSLRVRGMTAPDRKFTLDRARDDRDQLLLKGFESGFKELDKSRRTSWTGFDTFHKQALEILRSVRPDARRRSTSRTRRRPELRKTPTATTPFGQGACWRPGGLVEAGVRFSTRSRWAAGTRTARRSRRTRTACCRTLDHDARRR